MRGHLTVEELRTARAAQPELGHEEVGAREGDERVSRPELHALPTRAAVSARSGKHGARRRQRADQDREGVRRRSTPGPFASAVAVARP